ncbi:hypothetical protein L1049_024471 [Liquidambar formosana]|uniref:CW-type domain-containing protein n=1 Tax=Liquidambar formosana TaxID=63359 RepID=A0AAP0X1A5_LIQFO
MTSGLKMGGSLLNFSELPREYGFNHFVMLMKDQKLICRTQCINPPSEMPSDWNILKYARKMEIRYLWELRRFFLHPACQNAHEQMEWERFLGYLQKHNMVAIAKLELYELYILPPDEGSKFGQVVVAYWNKKAGLTESKKQKAKTQWTGPPPTVGSERVEGLTSTVRQDVLPSFRMVKELSDASHEDINGEGSSTSADKCSISHKFPQETGDHHAHESRVETCSRPQPSAVQYGLLEKNYVRADPSYLKTLGQAHSGWIFGAIAELVDNSRDAKATKLEIFVEEIYSTKAGKNIPMLSVIDDGHGMTHQEIVRMMSFGHKQPDRDDPDCIGRFGIGFKTGAMRLGRDALVLTQTADSRSVAFLSQSLNEGKDNLEIPIISYHRKGQFMEVDTTVQSEALAKNNLKSIKECSPFNKYLIGEKLGLFREKGTGTQIHIWNLDEWGSDYCLEWRTGLSGGSSFYQGDILIRSGRIRSRPGQITQKVPLDYSLQSYLEFIFLEPRMKIYVQHSLVKSRPLAKSLNMTSVEIGHIMGKHVQLTIGRCQLEWESANCGIFLYWHGRLIEAYKRVGGMILSADTGRGIIGVIDITGLMNDGNGHVWVHSNKQGFQDCEPYARLEEWLGKIADEYWDRNFDALQLKKGNALYKPDHEWVQCDKCRKWRMLSSGFDINNLPQEWFCYMMPFNGLCGTPEQAVDSGVITVSAKRSGYVSKQTAIQSKEVVQLVNTTSTSGGNKDDSIQPTEEGVRPPVSKRLRRGPTRACKVT